MRMVEQRKWGKQLFMLTCDFTQTLLGTDYMILHLNCIFRYCVATNSYKAFLYTTNQKSKKSLIKASECFSKLIGWTGLQSQVQPLLALPFHSAACVRPDVLQFMKRSETLQINQIV